MNRAHFSTAGLPRYHDAMLIVKMRPAATKTAAAAAATAAAAPGATAAAPWPQAITSYLKDLTGGALSETLNLAEAALTAGMTSEPYAAVFPGLARLAMLEKGGLIKRAVALSNQLTPVLEAASGAQRALATLISSVSGLADALSTPAAANLPQALGGGQPSASPDSAATRAKPDRQAGISILELNRESDTAALRDALASDPAVEFVSRVPTRYLQVPRRRAMRAPSRRSPVAATMWNLQKIRWLEARARAGFQEASRIKVAVLDTGVDEAHPDLVGRVKSYTYHYPNVPSAVGPKDYVGHGTHVCGTIAATINNQIGINGICQPELHVWKIFNDQPVFISEAAGYVYVVDPVMYRQALAACLDEEIDVLNLSIGGPAEPDHQERELYDLLLAGGTTIVAAMGNERAENSPVSYPAAVPGIVAVGATNIQDRVCNFSNRGSHIALCAPGAAIWSTLPTYPGQSGYQAVVDAAGRPAVGAPIARETNYDAWDGTSMATPHVTAAAALLLAKHRETSGAIPGAEVRRLLQNSADKVPAMADAVFHPDYGAGRLNLLNLLA